MTNDSVLYQKHVIVDAKKATETVEKRWKLLGELGFVPHIFSTLEERSRFESILGADAIADGFFASDILDATQTLNEFESWLLGSQITQADSLIEDTLWIHPHDDWTETILIIADRFRLPVQAGYRNCRVKPLARNLLGNRIPQPAFNVLSLDQLPTIFANGPPYRPVVAKPIVGAGSSWVSRLMGPCDAIRYRESRTEWICKNGHDIDSNSFFDFDPNTDLLVEEYLTGSVFQVDGFVVDTKCIVCDIGIKRHAMNPRVWSQGFAETGGVTCFPNANDEFVNRVLEWTCSVVRAVELNDSAFHIEGIWRGDELYVVEINPRVGGSDVARIASLLSDVDLHSEMTRLAVGVPNERMPTQTEIRGIAYCVIQPEQGRGLGEIIHLSPQLEADLHVFGKLRRCEWRPSSGIKLNDTVGKAPHEEYIGEFHVCFDEEIASSRWDEIAEQVSSIDLLDDYVQIRYES
ncbi:ATP-grasp domain-containing protein [Neorhodopirellula lusitana]|uniref:ATP-grasp domain-containing protein n=1 Tax=Neorhodopirellula lusitana TaxID=445327 RepID=UPI00384BCB03